jgi:hypothetical protein
MNRGRPKRWTEEEISFIKQNLPNSSYREIGRTLGRCGTSVRELSRRLGLSSPVKKHFWTKADDFRLIGLLGKRNIRKAAALMGISYQAVFKRVSHLRRQGENIRGGLDGYSLEEMIELTGYSSGLLKKARNKLGQKWKRLYPKSVNRRVVVSQEQLDACCEYLKNETREKKTLADRFWPRVRKSKKPNGCWMWIKGRTESLTICLPNGTNIFPTRNAIAWKLVHGNFPGENERLINTCGKRLCVKPAHKRVTHKYKPR